MNKTEKNIKKLKNERKHSKRIRKKEELPSFLLNVTDLEFERNAKPYLELAYSSPVFFGDCKQLHPIFHPVDFSRRFHALYSGESEESVRSNIFKSVESIKLKPPKAKKIHRPKKSRTSSFDAKSHHCPGARKNFSPDVTVFTPDLGQTTSVIEGETFREIPYRKIKGTITGGPKVEAENITLSDIKEKARDRLPYKQRMAHNHFPKELVTVKLIGPVIPASITITKMPTKRKRLSELSFDTRKKSHGKETDKKGLKRQESKFHYKTINKEPEDKSEAKETYSEEFGELQEEGEEEEVERIGSIQFEEDRLWEEESESGAMFIDEEEYEEELEMVLEEGEWEEGEEEMIAEGMENTEADKAEK